MASHSSNVQVSKVLMMLVSVLWFCNKYMIYPHHLTGIHHTLFIVSKASPPLLHHRLLPYRLIRGRHINIFSSVLAVTLGMIVGAMMVLCFAMAALKVPPRSLRSPHFFVLAESAERADARKNDDPWS